MTAAHPHPPRTALIAGFAAIYLIWGSTYLGIAYAVETMPPFLMASARFLVAGALVAGYIALTRGFRATAAQWRDNALIGGFLCLGGNGLVSWAEESVPSGIATLIISAGPVFIVLMDWAFQAWFRGARHEARPNLLTFTGLALGIAGLGILVGPDVLKYFRGSGLAELEGLDPWRVLGLLGATLFWGMGMIYMRYAKSPAEPFTASGIQMLTGSLWLLATAVATGELERFDPAAVTGKSLLAWGYLVVFGSLIGFSTFTWLMKHSTPAKVSTYAYVNPVVAVFLGWWFRDEPVGGRVFLAAAVIIVGVALITIAKNRKTTVLPRTAPPLPSDEPARRPAAAVTAGK